MLGMCEGDDVKTAERLALKLPKLRLWPKGSKEWASSAPWDVFRHVFHGFSKCFRSFSLDFSTFLNSNLSTSE